MGLRQMFPWQTNKILIMLYAFFTQRTERASDL